MSHVATINLQIKDIDALKDACSELGLDFMEGQTRFKAHANEGEGQGVIHAIRVGSDKLTELQSTNAEINRRDIYEIGICPAGKDREGNEQPGFKMLWDTYCGGNGLMMAVGPNAGLLKQTYGKYVAMKSARKQGFSVTEQKLENGAIKLVMMKAGQF